MSSNIKLIILLLFLLAGCRKKTNTTKNKETFLTLQAKAADEKQSPSIRLTASLEANSIANQLKDAHLRTESLRAIGVLYWKLDSTEQALRVFRQLSALADSVSDKLSSSVALNNIGLIFGESSLYDSASVYYEKAAKIFRTLKDSYRLAECLINMGISYKNIGAYEKAFSTTLEAANIVKDMPDALPELSTAYSTLGNVLKELKRPAEALAYHNKALAIDYQLKDSSRIAGSYNNIGNTYKSNKQYNLALEYYLKSLDLKTKLGLKKSRVTTIDNIADAYLGNKQYALAKKFELQALSLRDQNSDKDAYMTSASRLARIHLALHETAEAETLAQSIAKMANTPIYLKQQLDNALLLQAIYKSKNDQLKASSFAEQALLLKDSLFNFDMAAAISKMNVRFKTEEQQKNLELSQKNEIIQRQKITTQQYSIVSMAAAILLLLFITYLLFVSNKLKKQSNERAKLLMSELNHRIKNSLQVISSIMNIQTSITQNPKEIDIIEAGRRRIDAIGIVHNLLYQEEYTGQIQMQTFLPEIVENLRQAFQQNKEEIEISFQVADMSLSADQAIPLGLITNELLTNIYKYACTDEPKLLVEMELKYNSGVCNFLMSDNGLQWSRKETNTPNKGLGLLLIDMLVKYLKSSYNIYRKDNKNFNILAFKKS